MGRGKKISTKKCYYCGKQAVSREHVPPRSFFPENDEMRTNLITVPSCKKHNHDTSDNDNLVRMFFTMCASANPTAREIFNEKVLNPITKSPQMVKRILNDADHIWVESNRILQQTIKLTFTEAESNIVIYEMEKIAKGLYFNKYKKVWRTELNVRIPVMTVRYPQLDNLFHASKKHRNTFKWEGNAPSVFRYTIGINPTTNEVGWIWIVFYDGIDVFVAPAIDAPTDTVQMDKS